MERLAAPVRRPLFAVAALCAAALVVAGCGGAPDAAEPAAEVEPTLPVERPQVPADATSFAASSGSFTLAVPATWRLPTGEFDVAEAVWFTDEGAPEFDANVNVLIEPLGAEMTIQEYLDVSVANGPSQVSGFTPVDVRPVRLANGELGGRLEYTGEFRGQTFQFLAIVSIDGAVAAVATYTNVADAYAGAVAGVEPYLLTLAADGAATPEPKKKTTKKKKKKKKTKKAAKNKAGSAN